MNFQVSDIVKQVRITLDQNQVEESVLVQDGDVLELDDIILQKITQAARQVLMYAPLWLIDNVTPTSITAVSDNRGVIEFERPDDFLRLHYAKADDWKVPVRVALTDDTQAYEIAQSGVKGVMPTTTRPKVFLTGDDYIEFWGSKGIRHMIAIFSYIKVPKIVNDVLDFPNLLIEALYYMTAADVVLTYKDTQHSQALLNKAIEAMGGQSK